jgi:CRP/FNR family cyclic AMP-dependent transcriptional regulator
MNTKKGRLPQVPVSPLPASDGPAGAGDFDPASALLNSGIATSKMLVAAGQEIFTQGEPADAVFLIQRGRVKLTVVSVEGKEATLGLLGAGDFLGEYCIEEKQHVWMNTAVAVTDCALLKTGRNDMAAMMRREPRFLDFFLSFLLARSARMQEALLDQLLNSSEKRLARTLLLLADFQGSEEVKVVAPRINHETLAAMVGTTRARITSFMNRFRKLGYIGYSPDNRQILQVHRSLINVLADPEFCGECSRLSRQKNDCVRCCTSVPWGMGRMDNL